ncbi:MAG: hypothetical protein NZZ41_07470, partial [Candidatus Dojkabacteria bacterium]|nr:hypothetical protein [Candidatus Dojkabacteria bacterium]
IYKHQERKAYHFNIPISMTIQIRKYTNYCNVCTIGEKVYHIYHTLDIKIRPGHEELCIALNLLVENQPVRE